MTEIPVKNEVDPTLRDPNEQWSKQEIPPGELNGFTHFRDENGEDPLQGQQVKENAAIINTEWEKLPDKAQMKEAIENAFRAVLLSPRKNLRWNTIHYQDLMDARSTDPTDLWRHLEKKRQDYNENHGYDRYSHRPYASLLPQLRGIVYGTYKRKVSRPQAEKKFERLLFEWEKQEQDQVMREEKVKPRKKPRLMYQIENEANKRLAQRISQYIKERQTAMDEPEGPEGIQTESAAGIEQATQAIKREKEEAGEEYQQPTYQQPAMIDIEPDSEKELKKDRYGAFMGSHLQAIAKISFYAEDILKAALEDIHQHESKGFHFRSTVLQLKVPGVGPKVCSFAWLLLAPMKSQLATIDTHMMDVLGKNYDKEMNNRDYFQFERELKARRDAAGYDWMPLGMFQWGMWDYKRSGEGEHQDHSGLQVLNPKDYNLVNWQKTEKNLKGDEKWPEPYWWELTKGIGDQEGEAYKEQISPTVAQNKVPYEKLAKMSWKLAAYAPTPWFIHPHSGERLEGLPGETLMQHIRSTTHLSTPEIWNLVGEAGKA